MSQQIRLIAGDLNMRNYGSYYHRIKIKILFFEKMENFAAQNEEYANCNRRLWLSGRMSRSHRSGFINIIDRHMLTRCAN